MASVKVKFRPSATDGREGSIYYQVIHNRAVRQITADLHVHKNEWNAGTSSVTIPSWADVDRKHHLHIIQKHISRDVLRLENIIRDLTLKGVCSAAAIVDGYRKQTSLQSFFNFMDSVIGHLKRLNRERTSETYTSALSSFMRFRWNKDIQLDDMDEDLIMEYEAWLKTNGASMNTISFYMRILRATYNRAVEKGLTVQKHPFKHVYTGMDKTVKRAISLKDIRRIKELDLTGKPHWELARDMFLFSFYTRGMSFIDMAYLKKSDLKNGILSYRRHKTGQQLHIRWESCMEETVKKYAAGCSGGMLEQLKKVYVERVVRNGFEDNSLYNDELLKLDDLELQEFDDLKKIIGQTKAMPKTNQVDINNQGLNNEEYEEKEKLEKKPKKELTEEEKRRLEELKKKTKNREAAISILRGISIRMPLLIYGAELDDEDDEITIDNFAEKIDPRSWEEFMPKGVSKQKFNAFKKYYDPDIFRAAGKRIRAMAKAADKLSVEERIGRITDIFSTFRNPDKETVLTPWRVVNMHLGDCLGGYCFFDKDYEHTIDEPRFIDHGKVTEEVFTPDSRILEINSKSGLYPLYMAYGIYRSRLKDSTISADTLEEQQEVWDKVVAENIFVVCKTPMAKSITKRTLVGFRKAKVNTRYFEDLINQIKNKPQNFIEKMAKGRSFWKANDDDNMKFNAIVGNPPYQVMDGGTDRGSIPVYQYFMNIAKRIHPNYISLIMPARWYAGGRGLDEFRSNMISDTHLSQLHDYELSKDLFPTVDIAGGLCTFLWDANYNGTCKITNYNALKDITVNRYLNQFETLIRSNAAVSILEKITSKSKSYLNSLVLSINPFGFRTYFRGSDKGDVKILTSKGWAKVFRTDISKGVEYIDQFKIIVGRFVPSNGEMSVKPGEGYRVLTEPQILSPAEINTETYIDTAVFSTLEEAMNYKKYLLTKFARFLLRQGITSVNVTKECFAFVPIQDFTNKSDIVWSKNVSEVDFQLYAKYHLAKDEIEFIEKMIKVV